MDDVNEVDDKKQLYEELKPDLESALKNYPKDIKSAPNYVPDDVFKENYIPDEIVDMIISMASDGFDPGKYGLRSFQRKWIIKLGKKLMKNEEKDQAFRKATYIGTMCIPDTDWDYGVTIKKREYKKLLGELNPLDDKPNSIEFAYKTEHTMFNPQPDLPRAEKIIEKGTEITITTADIAAYTTLSNDIYKEAKKTIALIKEANIFCDNIITKLDEIKKKIHPDLYLKKVSYEILEYAMKSIDPNAVVPYTSQFRYAFYLQQIAYELVHNNTIELSNRVIATISANTNRADQRDKNVASTATHAATMLDRLTTPPPPTAPPPPPTAPPPTAPPPPPPTAQRSQDFDATANGTGSSSVSKKKTKKRKRAKKRRSRRKV